MIVKFSGNRLRIGGLAVVALCMLAFAQQGLAQTRRVVIEHIDEPGWFALSGQQWTLNSTLPLVANATLRAAIPFPLNIGGHGDWYDACVSENGFLFLLRRSDGFGCSSPLTLGDAALALRSYLASDVSSLRPNRTNPLELDGTAFVSNGYVDTAAAPPYSLSNAAEAIGFTWYKLLYAYGSGDFDVVFTYATRLDGSVVIPRGANGLHLRASFIAPNPQLGSTDSNYLFCFRGGRLTSCQ